MMLNSVGLLGITIFAVIPSVMSAKCQKGFTQLCGPPDGCQKSCTNPVPEDRCKTLPCETGCFCPKQRPIQTVDDNFAVKCVSGLIKCPCSGGREWRTCRLVPEPTCNNPTPAKGKCQGPPGCYCPRGKPIWHNGKCISKNQCVCPDMCVTVGCLQCKKCPCRNGRFRCEETKFACPVPSTAKGLKQLENSGCWGLTLISKQCIFFTPCPKGFEPIRSRSCKSDLIQTTGCWTLMHGHCTFVAPCPEDPGNTCTDLNPGTITCKMCKKCECMNGLKICHGPGICPDPEKSGCATKRTYPGTVPDTCYWVSPCPSKALSDKKECSQLYIDQEDFCYVPSQVTGDCEFISPCPVNAVCNEGDTVCRDCRECRCQKGVVQCQAQDCGDPIKHGCWVDGSTVGHTKGCLFVSPCPIGQKVQNCRGKEGEVFCSECNTCTCRKEGKMSCTKTKCTEPTVTAGCYVSYKGTCIFVFPCP